MNAKQLATQLEMGAARGLNQLRDSETDQEFTEALAECLSHLKAAKVLLYRTRQEVWERLRGEGLDHQTIADLAGVSRPQVTQVFNKQGIK